MATQYEQALEKALHRAVELEQYLGSDKLTLIENSKRLGLRNRELKKENEKLIQALERRDKTEEASGEQYNALLKKYQNLMVANHALTLELCEVKEKCLGINEPNEK